tara:strand:+ start:639 stop:2399 length:1761 start_codon:yes stop_codon:yes gene_type:complete
MHSEAALALGINLRGQMSGLVQTVCPQCSHTRKKNTDPCLNVNLLEGYYKCWHCEWKGSLKGAQKSQNYIPQPPKPKKQGEYNPSELRPLKDAELAFFQNRGISEDVLFKSGVRGCTRWMPQTQADTNTLAFQFIKSNQRVNTKYRTADKQMSQDKGGEKCFYNFEALEKKPKKVFITEGEIDALTLIECGFKDVVSVPDGAPNPTANNLDNKFSYFTDEAMKLFDEIPEIVLVTDNDENGRFLESELRRRLGIDKCLFVQYPEGSKDINDVLVKEGAEAVEDVLISAKHYPVDGLHTFKDYENEIIDMYNGVAQEYWKTGWPHMDKHLKVKGGQLNVVTGTPGSGKSEWVDDLMINTVHNYGAKWAVFSPENYPVKVYFRKLSEKYENQNFNDFNEPTLNNSINELSTYINLIVDNDKDEVTMDYLFERIRTLVFRKGIKAVIIDPWNEIEHTIGSREDIYLAKMLRKIKRFIRKYDLSFWLVAHPKNPQKDKDGNYFKTTAYDIAGGYTWNAKADNIFSVWRDRQNNKKPVEVDTLKIKYKTDGELGTCKYFYQYATGKFQSCGSSLDDPTQVEDKGGKSVNGW